MPLQHLVSDATTAQVQRTTLSIDVLGRHVCSTWDEATGNGGSPFDVIIIGAGMCGGYLAAKLYRRNPTARILLLEAGPFLVGEHVQNLGNIGLNVPPPIDGHSDPGVPRDLVWGLPWRGNVEFPGLAYCVGGKSLYWGGWCPRLTADDLTAWPAATAAYLAAHYLEVESETGVVPGTDFIFGVLQTSLEPRLVAAAAATTNIDTSIGEQGVQHAPLAVQGEAPVSGLFGFDKFSSVPLLIDAVRDDVAASGLDDAARRLFIVPLAACRQPDAFAGLVLIGPSPRYIDDDGYQGGFSDADIHELLESIEANHLGWATAMAPVIMGNPDRPELAGELTELFCRADPAVASRFARVTFMSDNRADLSGVAVPTLVLQCRDDAIAPAAVTRYVHQQISGSTLVELDATGHCPNLSAPTATAEAIRSFVAHLPG